MEPFPLLKNQKDIPLDQVRVSGLIIECIVGIYPSERTTPQNVRLDVCLYTDISAAAKSSSIEDALDYSRVSQELAFILQHGEFQLIESAAEVIGRFLSAKYGSLDVRAPVVACCVRVSKLDALSNGAVPSVQISRAVDPGATGTDEGLITLFNAANSRLIQMGSLKPLQAFILPDELTKRGHRELRPLLFPLDEGLVVDSMSIEKPLKPCEFVHLNLAEKSVVNKSSHRTCFLMIS